VKHWRNFSLPLQVWGTWLAAVAGSLYFIRALQDHSLAFNQLVTKWDAGWYLSIASGGYALQPGQQSNVAFFPVYPLIVRLVHDITRLPLPTTAVVVSVICFGLALVVMHKWLKLNYSDRVASTTLWLVALFPFGFFFALAYTEALFILLVSLVLWLTDTRRFWLAALVTAIAGATKVVGVLLVIIVVGEYLQHHDWRHSRMQLVGIGATCGLGLLAFMAYLKLRFGDALAFVHVQRYWPGRTDGLHGLARSVASLVHDYPFSNPYALNLTELVLAAIFGALAVYCVLRVRRSWGLFALAALVIPLSTGSIISVNRYAMVLVPCFVSAAVLMEKRNIDQMVLTISAIMLAVFFYAYTSTMVFLG
jgi:MFS family permease